MKTKLIIILIFSINIIMFGQETPTISEKLSMIAYCGENTKLEEKIDLEYVKTDIDIIKNYINSLPEKIKTVKDLLKIYPSFETGKKCNCSSETFELGRNLKFISYTQYGGYSSFNIDIVYSNESILKLRITIESNSEIIEKYLKNEMKILFECKNGIPTFEKHFSENIRKYERDNGKIFFQIEDTNVKRKEVVNYFLDNLSGSEFKEPYYLLDLSFAFDNLRYLILNKDIKALKIIVRSANPTSRFLSARALKYLNEKDTFAQIELEKSKLIKSEIVSCWINKFEYDYYDVNKNFEILLKTK